MREMAMPSLMSSIARVRSPSVRKRSQGEGALRQQLWGWRVREERHALGKV